MRIKIYFSEWTENAQLVGWSQNLIPASQNCPQCGKLAHGGECNNCGWVNPEKVQGQREKPTTAPQPQSEPKPKREPKPKQKQLPKLKRKKPKIETKSNTKTTRPTGSFLPTLAKVVGGIAFLIILAAIFGGNEEWVPGSSHSSRDNIIASEREGVWLPSPGYDWRDDTRREVVWVAGQTHPNGELVSSFYEGEWFRANDVEVDYAPDGTVILRGRDRDGDPIIGNSGSLPGNPLLMNVPGSNQILIMYRHPETALTDIAYFVYSTEYQWLAAIRENGEIREVERRVPVVLARAIREAEAIFIIEGDITAFQNGEGDPEDFPRTRFPLEKTASAAPVVE